MIESVRKKIEDNGKALISDSDEIAFSRHGSLYQKQTTGKVNDIDIYVVLNGFGLWWGQCELAGKQRGENPNLTSFNFL